LRNSGRIELHLCVAAKVEMVTFLLTIELVLISKQAQSVLDDVVVHCQDVGLLIEMTPDPLHSKIAPPRVLELAVGDSLDLPALILGVVRSKVCLVDTDYKHVLTQ
jgi:hypothetical protein